MWTTCLLRGATHNFAVLRGERASRSLPGEGILPWPPAGTGRLPYSLHREKLSFHPPCLQELDRPLRLTLSYVRQAVTSRVFFFLCHIDHSCRLGQASSEHKSSLPRPGGIARLTHAPFRLLRLSLERSEGRTGRAKSPSGDFLGITFFPCDLLPLLAAMTLGVCPRVPPSHHPLHYL